MLIEYNSVLLKSILRKVLALGIPGDVKSPYLKNIYTRTHIQREIRVRLDMKVRLVRDL